MTSIIKVLAVISMLSIQSCIINNVQAEDCVIKEITVTKIKKGTSFDIVIYDGKDDFYYINRGEELGLDISVLKEKLLNKKATLHLYKFWFGTSDHISQLEVDDKLLFTEFQAEQGYSEF